MKKLVSILILCLGCFGFLEAQDNIWRLLNCETPFLGAASNGDLFAMDEYGCLLRSQDEGGTWTQVNDNHMYQCIAFSPEGRIFVFPTSNTCLQFSDDGGDTWQATSTMASCAMYDVGGLCAPTNDIVVVWATNGETYWTTDGGETWDFAILEADDGSELSDMIVNAEGDVYVSVWSYSDGDTGIFHSTLSDMENWEIVAAEELNIRDMAFDPEGNVVACGIHIDGSSIGFQHTPGFYLFDGTTLAISDGGIVYRPHFYGNQAVLSYSTDHGEHFTDIGEHVPLVDIAPGGDAYFLIKGHDNHLYFDGGGEYWKCIRDADEIITDSPTPYHPIVEDGKQWNVLFSYPWSPPEPQHKYTDIYKIEGDTLLDGVSYKVMYTTRNEDLTDWSFCGVIRETENKQVFYRGNGSADERMLYDFSMQVGDTIFMYEEYMVVIETGEVLVGDEPRQQIVLEYPFGGTETWIEGMGSLYGIIDSGSQFLVGGSTDLLCYYEDGDLIWQNSSLSLNSCYFVYSGGGGQSGLVVTPTVLTFDEPAVPQTFTISNQLDNNVTITNIYVQPDDSIVLVSHTDLPQTLQSGESMDVEVELNGIGNKGYNTYHIYVLTSEGAKVVVVRVNENAWVDYVPLVHEGNDRQKWNVVYIGSMNYPNDYHTEIQSIRDNINLDGVDYKLVWTESVYQSKRIAGAVREEDKRVYFRRYWGQSYEDEVLLYDFNLTVGDTVSVGWSDYRLIVLEESEIEVNGTMRRQLGLAEYFAGSTNYEVEEYWIEGVGSTYGFLNSGYEGWVGAFVHLLCYHENGDLVWDNESFDECVMNSDGAPATFAPQGAEWYFDVFNPWGTHPEYERFFVDGDTIIQGHQCSIIIQRFVDTGHDGEEYVYEEDNKVYWFNPTTNAFSTLYDFDAEAGESWYYEVGECSHLAIVDSVGSVTWNGHTYRTQWVRFNDDLPIYYSGKIIEGIGYERGLFPNYYVCNGLEVYDYSEIEYLRCYVDDGEILYHEGDYDCDAIGNNVDDGTLNAYCEAPFNFGGSPISDQGTCGAQLWWNKPFASHWFHYDEKPYAGSVYRNSWGIKIPAEEIQRGDFLTHVAFYRAGEQNQTMEYRFAFSFEGEMEPDSWDYLSGNSVQVEPGLDGWVMAKLGSPIECEEGKCLWIVLEALNVMGNSAAYCQASGNSNACWSSEGSAPGDWMIRGYFTNDVGYNDPDYNEDLDHYNIYRGSSLDELEKIAEVGRDEEEYFDTLQQPFGDYYYQLTAAYTDGRESVPARRGENPHDPDYVYFHVGNISSLGSEWYYEILGENGNVTYQHLEYAADTTVNDKEVKIIIRTNTLYDKMERNEVTREYIYEDFGKVYWWNESIQDFTMLYDLGAQVGDEWVIRVGEQSITMHVDTVEQYEYESQTYRMLTVSDADDLYSGRIVSGIGHLTSFFPEKLMTCGKNYRVEGIRCYWREGELVFKYGDRDCDEVYMEYHNGIEETDEAAFAIYPNPTNGVLYVKTRRATFLQTATEYRITNLMGQTVLMGNLTAETQQIDVSVLPQGMYFISVGNETRKVVIQ